MTAQSCLQELTRELLLGRKPQCVGFVDGLLRLAQEVGEIQCTSSAGDRLRFLIGTRPPAFEVELDAAVSKLRMMCARLSVLCNESGGQDVSLYGGEGVIEKTSASLPVSASSDHERMAREDWRAGADESNNCIPASLPSLLNRSTDLDLLTWKVRFKNTMHEQEFTITRLSD